MERVCSMKGIYTLVIEIPHELVIDVGRLGKIQLQRGVWVYVGSALGTTSTNLVNRIKRHLSDNKKTHWHIDYVLQSEAGIREVIWAETSENVECKIATSLYSEMDFLPGPKGLGASDCEGNCEVHLFLFTGNDICEARLKSVFLQHGLEPKKLKELKW